MPGADAQRSDPRVLGQLNSSITLSEELKITADKKVTTATNKGRCEPRVTGPAARRAERV